MCSVCLHVVAFPHTATDGSHCSTPDSFICARPPLRVAAQVVPNYAKMSQFRVWIHRLQQTWIQQIRLVHGLYYATKVCKDLNGLHLVVPPNLWPIVLKQHTAGWYHACTVRGTTPELFLLCSLKASVLKASGFLLPRTCYTNIYRDTNYCSLATQAHIPTNTRRLCWDRCIPVNVFIVCNNCLAALCLKPDVLHPEAYTLETCLCFSSQSGQSNPHTGWLLSSFKILFQ